MCICKYGYWIYQIYGRLFGSDFDIETSKLSGAQRVYTHFVMQERKSNYLLTNSNYLLKCNHIFTVQDIIMAPSTKLTIPGIVTDYTYTI